jgi:hypothetical protein
VLLGIFGFLFCEIPRFFCYQKLNAFHCRYTHTVLHISLFLAWTLLVFYRAHKKSKVFYTKRQVLAWLITIAGYFLYILFWSKHFLGCDFIVRSKVLLFLCYIFVIPQFLKLVEKKDINICLLGIGICLCIYIIFLYSRYHPVNPNYLACLLNFFTTFIILNDEIISSVRCKMAVYFLSILCMYRLGTRFSLLLSLLVIPWCFCRYGAKKNNFNMDSKYKQKINVGNHQIIIKNPQPESHNFYIEMWRHFNILDFLLMLYCLLSLFFTFTYFSIMHLLLLALYCMTTTTPLYFFIVVLGLRGKKL